MSGTEATLYEVAGGAAWITLNRPENRNALSAVLVNELNEHLITANNDPDVRSIVITGSDPAFCAGADLKSPPGEAIDPMPISPPPLALTAHTRSSPSLPDVMRAPARWCTAAATIVTPFGVLLVCCWCGIGVALVW